MYILQWRNPGLDANKAASIQVPVGLVVSDKSSLTFTGKGSANYGKIQQENLMRLLENFADTAAPQYPTMGQTWWDAGDNVLRVCASTTPLVWKSLGGIQVTDIGDPAPTPAALGDMWFQRTGSTSGFLYVYNGVGRYPATDWVAPADYFPDASTTAAVILNASAYGPPNTNYAEVYISAPGSDTDGTIIRNGSVVTLPRGSVATSQPATNALIVWDTTGTMVVGSNTMFPVIQFPDGKWYWDNNSSWVEFTPALGMYAVGRMTVADYDFGAPGAAPGITAAEIWSETRDLSSMNFVPDTLAGGAIGGWSQVWPAPEFTAGREEYNLVLSYLNKLIGAGDGGNDSLGRAVTINNLLTQDASLRVKYAASLPLDSNILSPTSELQHELLVDPTSNDWDMLLAACKYAVNRLDGNTTFTGDISPVPFVYDGRPAPAALLALSPSEIRYPSIERRSGRRFGSITLNRLFTETVNTLAAAVQNRYSIAGINGASGTSITSPTLQISHHAQFGGAVGGATTGTITLRYNFPTNKDRESFLNSGGGVQLTISHVPGGSGTAADTNFKTLCDSRGVVRLTRDKMRTFGNVLPLVMSAAVVNAGLVNGTIGTNSLGGANITYSATFSSVGAVAVMDVTISFNSTGAMNGTTTIEFEDIKDVEVYNNPTATRVYSEPNAYVTGDKVAGSAFLTFIS